MVKIWMVGLFMELKNGNENGELILESGPDKDYGYLGTNKY